MSIDRDTLIFFDASCLIAGSASAGGASRFLLRLCQKKRLTGAVSQQVLVEAERNIRDKLGRDVLATYHNLLESIAWEHAGVPPAGERSFESGIVEKKDEHVLAAALAAEASYLVTLDQSLENNVNQTDLPVCSLSPGGFIKRVLINHVDYQAIRDDVD